MTHAEQFGSRRSFLKLAASGAAGAYLGSKLGWWRALAQVPGGTLPPDGIPKFIRPLTVPRAMPLSAKDATTDYYSVGIRQMRQQVLPPSLPTTKVWAYGSLTDASTFAYPTCTIETRVNRRARVKWVNQLMDSNGKYLPHLFAVDQTLHWANPAGGVTGRDMHGHDPAPYTGPVPIVSHLHGAHVGDESDGYPEAWFLPAASNIPAGYAKTGTWYNYFAARFQSRYGGGWEPGSATYLYPNDQAATALWFHDHALGMTRLNVYSGAVGFYLLRGGAADLAPGTLPGPAPAPGDKAGQRYYEIPLVIQDRSFNADGSLFYPSNRAFFEGMDVSQLQIPFIPDDGCTGPSDVSPIWNPEFFGNTMVVNGQTWPYLEVEQRRYRFRLLNACDSRFLMLKLSRAGLPFWQIGADGGFLPAPIRLDQLLIAPSERADVIVDFTAVPVGTEIVLNNIGPDEPFGGGLPGVDFDPSDATTTGMVMQFRVVPSRSRDVSVPPDRLTLPAAARLGAAGLTRRLSLNEAESATVLVDGHPGHGHRAHMPAKLKMVCNSANSVPFGPTMAMLGTVTPDGGGNPLRWMDDITENPAPGDTEIWEVHNFTADAHPVHVHQVQFEVVGRTSAEGLARGPEPWEAGPKDTVISYPGEVTQLKARFDRAGQYVWHCHILSHEDNEMMRPFSVGPVQRP